MKVIQSRFYIEKANEGSIIQDRTSLLVWFLSVMKWKELGYEPYLYTDKITKEKFDELGLTLLYDKVIILSKDNVNTDVFWASSKILSAKKFMETYPCEEFIISDLDFIPLADPKKFASSDNSLVTFYPEYVQMYSPMEYLKINPEYNIPEFFTGKIDPINTCFLYIQKNNLELFTKYLDIEMNFINYNYDFESGQISNDLMIFIEQRMFTEYLVSNNITIDFTNPKNKSVFNINGLHTGPYKSIEKAEYFKWIIWYFKIIKEINEDIYNNIISLELYSDIKEIVDNKSGEYIDKKDNTKKIKDFSWDKLEYPRAFEDIYDSDWNG